MCGRFGFAKPKEQIMKRFNVERVPDNLTLRYNISPSQNAAAILNKFPNQVVLCRFGLVPSWSKEDKSQYTMINARCETVFEKPTYKRLIKSKRALILADNFFEWRKVGLKKIPYRIFLKNEEPFAMAGLWDSWGEGTSQFFSFSILTTSANNIVLPLHDRMPILLDPEDEAKWLQDDTPMNVISGMFRSYPAEKMDAYPISPLVNSPSNDSIDILKPVPQDA